MEIVNIRVAVTAAAPQGELEASASGSDRAQPVGQRRMWVGERRRFERVPVYQRDKLGLGAKVVGPALVQEASTTLVLPAGAVAMVDRSGSLLVDLLPAALASAALAGTETAVTADAN